MLGLSHDRHTGRLLAHQHTSYGGLALLLGLVGALALLVTLAVGTSSSADSGTMAVTATVAGTPPSSSPVISDPKNGSTVGGSPLRVSGSCDSSTDYTVVVMDNGVARGSAFCAHGGTFSLMVSLNPGSNVFTAHYVDSLGQSGPASSAVTVMYLPAPAASVPVAPTSGASRIGAAPTGSRQAPAPLFSVTAPYHFTPIQPGNNFTLNGDLEGGTAPYAVNVDWGDGSQPTLLSRVAAGAFTLTHIYAQAGRYTIRLSATDAAGATSFFQTTLDVGGGVAPSTSPTSPTPVTPGELIIVWPLFLMICLVALSFWLGEHYDRHHWHPSPPTP